MMKKTLDLLLVVPGLAKLERPIASWTPVRQPCARLRLLFCRARACACYFAVRAPAPAILPFFDDAMYMPRDSSRDSMAAPRSPAPSHCSSARRALAR